MPRRGNHAVRNLKNYLAMHREDIVLFPRMKKKPRKISIKKRYSYLGMADDYQRSIIWTIIDRSARGLWTRYSDIEHDAKTQMMSQILRDDRYEIKYRIVTGLGTDGRKTWFVEFAV